MYGDKNKIKQIINNMLENACRFTNNGTISVMISKNKEKNSHFPLKKINHPKLDLVFKIKDTGIGIKSSKTNIFG